MAELLKCNVCGFITVRSGMTNHMKAKHPLDFIAKPIEDLTTSQGSISYKEWAKIKAQVNKKCRT